jgi:glucose/arabinose dehydrogenase
MRTGAIAWIRAGMLAMLASGVAGASTVVAQTVSDPGLRVELVTSGLSLPTSMAFIGDDDILVLQKNDGRVRRILNGTLQPGFVLDVAVHSFSERGLLGIAVDPDFIHNRQVFLYYTESATGGDTAMSTSIPLGNRIYRYTWDGSALVNPVLIADLPATSGPNHNGGVIAFGPDDALYAIIGDLNRGGKLQNFPSGPDPDDSGVILRLDRNGQPLQDSPFFNPLDPADPMNRYYAYGIRNSFGLAFDPVTGGLWDTENGPNVFDEVNRIPPGFNSGWTKIMGPDSRDPQDVGELWHAPGSIYLDPAFSWSVPVAPTAIAFSASPILGCGLRHDVLVGDSNCGQIYRFRPDAARQGLSFASLELQDKVADNDAMVCSGEMSEILFGSGFGTITDLENGPDGRMYIVSLFEGMVLRLSPRPVAFPDQDGDGVDDACDCAPTDGTAFTTPAEVPWVRLSEVAGAASLGWDPQAATAGQGTTYTVVTGDVGALGRDGGFASACTLSQGIPAPPFVDPRADPPVGSGRYFLLRAENACGAGTFGDGTGLPDPRDALDLALPPPCDPAARVGGAMISFRIAGESLAVWVTNDAFIDRAAELLASGGRRIPVFGTLLDGRDCDARWTWHVDPDDVSFADAAIELCDGLPSHIESNKTYWLKTVGSFCPWSAEVAAVDDRR